jgi:50S ribosomal protein L16 3-hydroxylase
MTQKHALSDPARFLRDVWQRRPLLVRGAFPGFRDPVTPEDLAGLACREDVESRLVMERGGAKPWQVTFGPQRAASLRRLPSSHWSLLVQGVDRWVPGVAALLDSFRFIPDWRVDDVMVSFAPRGGGVGPHTDSYDVFLLQGKGRRRWRIDTRAAEDFKPGLDLRILKSFRPEREWVLEPGDMLYLPPGVAHEGVALEDCLTYSVGFRAPSGAELLAAALPRLGRNGGGRYRDPSLNPARFPGEISSKTVEEMRRLLASSLRTLGKADFGALVGELVTETKEGPADEKPVDGPLLRAALKKGGSLARSPGSRLAFLRRGASVDLFADGRRYPLGPGLAFAGPLLTDRRVLPAAVLNPHMKKPAFAGLLAALAAAGVFRVER